MSFPTHARHVVIGAGIHGLSTAWRLAERLRAAGKGSGADILVLDKSAIAAGASGIACGVVRNNYFQPAMRELMAHSVDVWETDPKGFSYHPVGYMQVSHEAMREDVTSIYEQQKEIGYPSEFIEGEKDCMTYMKGLLSDWRAEGVTSVLHEKKGGYANNTAAIYGLANKAEAQGVRIITGVTVTGFERGSNSDAVSAVVTDRGTIECDRVVVAVGPWVKTIWDMLDLPREVSIKGPDGRMHGGIPTWRYWCLEEGVIGVDPDLQKLNDGGMPPVIHVDTDAPLRSDVDGSVITEKPWGIYYKPDFQFDGVQGGAMPYEVKTLRRRRGDRSLRPRIAGIHRRRRFRPHVVLGAGLLPGALLRPDRQIQKGAVGRPGLLHTGQLPGVRHLLRERPHHRRQQPRFQNDRRRPPGCGRNDGRQAGPARTVPLQPLRRGQAAPDEQKPVPLELIQGRTTKKPPPVSRRGLVRWVAPLGAVSRLRGPR